MEKSENESEKRETLADIVAEIRHDIKLGNNYYAANLPDRIEAARKREKAEIEADALAVGGIVEAERHKPGNVAAMRDACANIAVFYHGQTKSQWNDEYRMRIYGSSQKEGGAA